MPTPAYLYIEGEVQGKITTGTGTKGSVGGLAKEEHPDEILVEAFSHEITHPTEPQSGQPSGPRLHKPLVITKMFDKSSPLLYNACASGEKITKFVLKWYRIVSGHEEHYFTHELEDAIIVYIKAYMPNCLDTANERFTHMEEVSFAYRKITWTHVSASTQASDDWYINPQKTK
jgi:type VI secretion system secreted protein Hcp